MDAAAPDVQPRPSVVELNEAIAVLGRFPALAGVTLTVGPGEIVLLRGPNGAGKTTLLRLCAGRIPLARGEGTVLGCDIRTERRHLRPLVGVLGHRNGLYLDLTVTENVQFWASVVGAGQAEVATVLDRLGLSGRLASLPARRLSAGQMRRTAFACFVVRRAHLWLLDEPHTGLDATARDEIDDLIRQASTSGVTVILASHELERASALATRTVELAGGMVTADTPLRSRQADRRGSVATQAAPGQSLDDARFLAPEHLPRPGGTA